MQMRILILLTIFSFNSQVFAQQTKEWLEMLEKPEYKIDLLQQENVKEKYSKYDFSTLLTPKTKFLGYIDPSFRRIKIYFTAISKNKGDGMVYDIEGISLVGDNRCDFKGGIRIAQIREYKTMHHGVEDEYKHAGLIAQGVLIGEYKFEENSNQSHSGIFEGIMTLNWYMDQHNIIHYDNLELYSDRYRNNQYIGSWTEYGKTAKKVCNWGEYRIPFSGDLDIGAAEFSPNPKYYESGWKNYNFWLDYK
jgi:hypothetical protein